MSFQNGYSEGGYSDIEEDDDLMTIKKFLNTISEEIFSPFKDPIPDIEEFSKNPGSSKKFYNYINTLQRINRELFPSIFHQRKLYKNADSNNMFDNVFILHLLFYFHISSSH